MRKEKNDVLRNKLFKNNPPSELLEIIFHYCKNDFVHAASAENRYSGSILQLVTSAS